MISPAPHSRPKIRLRTPGILRDQRGVTMIEMALVLPVFFLLLFGLFNFSIVLFGYSNATFAARAGARYASLHSATSLQPASSSSISTLVSQYLFAAPAGGVTISTAYSPGQNSNTFSAGNTVGSNVTVSVTIVYPMGIPFSTLSQITVGSTAQRTVLR